MDVNALGVEVGCALLSGDWRPVDKNAQTKRMPPVPDQDAAVIDYCRLVAAPDSYRVAFHLRPVELPYLGGYRFGYQVPDFSEPRLAMSDLLPATAIRPTFGPSRFNKGDLYVQANPFARFSVQQPLFLYFEIYDLTYGAEDQTRYAVEYVLTPEREERTGLRLFRRRGDQPALSLRMERAGDRRSPREYAEVDVSRIDPGPYILTVRVTDLVTDETTERSRSVLLTK